MNNIEILEELLAEGFSAMCPLEAEAIENLIKEYKELKEKQKEYEKQLDLDYVEENYIPKSKVKEKLEEIYKEYVAIMENEKRSLEDKNICAFQHGAMRTVLEELLEGE